MSTLSKSGSLRLALFAEGTSGKDLEDLWSTAIPALLDLPRPERVVGFSKHHLVAMSNANMKLAHRTSTISVGLDALIARELERKPFDCAVVAWDLVPAWDSGSDASACRWKDTLLLYEGLARSSSLPVPWRERAEARYQDLKARERPSARGAVPRPAPSTVLSVCMAPEFEGLLLDEMGIKAALEVAGKSIPGWPDTWARMQAPRPSETLARAIESARCMRPKPAVFRKVRRPFREAKHEWGSLFLGRATGAFRKKLVSHAISHRLRELLVAPAS